MADSKKNKKKSNKKSEKSILGVTADVITPRRASSLRRASSSRRASSPRSSSAEQNVGPNLAKTSIEQDVISPNLVKTSSVGQDIRKSSLINLSAAEQEVRKSNLARASVGHDAIANRNQFPNLDSDSDPESGNATPSKKRRPTFALNLVQEDLVKTGAPHTKSPPHSVFVPRKVRPEAWYQIQTQVSFPFLFAGVGMVIAGFLLDFYVCLKVFKEINELTVLITPLIGLRGNLEMTMATRLCTKVNLGQLDTYRKRIKVALNDTMVSQIQAIFVALVSGALAIAIVLIESDYRYDDYRTIDRLAFVWACSLLTAVTVTFLIASLNIALVFLLVKFHLNPDNVITPTAAFLGDTLTLISLRYWAQLLFPLLEPKNNPTHHLSWIVGGIVFCFILLLPFLFYFALKDAESRDVLKHCWIPALIAVVISTAAGTILEKQGQKFHNMNLYQPVINGVGAILAIIQYNRISTAYNRDATLGVLPEVKLGRENKICNTPLDVACYQGQQSVSFWVLATIAIPGQINFAMLTYFLIPGHVPDCFEIFIALYILASLLQIFLLLYLTLTLTNFFWKLKIAPDTYVIPVVSACADLIGTSFIFIVCEIVYKFKYCKNGLADETNHNHHAECHH